MDTNSFLVKMQAIDDELAKKEVRIYARAFHAFPLFSPNYNGLLLGYGIDHRAFGDYEGPNLLEKINDWYKQVYAERFNAPTDLGKVPVILKREIFLIRIPLVFGTSKIEILPLVNGLTQSMAKHLSTAELNEIQQRFIEGYSLVYEFEDLRSQVDAGNRSGAKRNDNPFLDSALRDMGTASDCLEGAVDTNSAVFHSQQLAEKMLKAVLFHFKNMTEEEIRKKYYHRMLDVYKDVCSLANHVDHVDSEVKNIAKYKMDIRYTSTVVEKGEAVRAYWSGLRIGGLCATLLSSPMKT